MKPSLAMLNQRTASPSKVRPSLSRRLVWPGAISLVLAAMAACGGSSQNGDDLNSPLAGSGGSLGISGTTGTTGTTAGRPTSSSGSDSGGKPAAGGQDTMGGEPGKEPAEGGNDAGGAPNMPPGPMDHGPMNPPDGMAGAGGAGADCPLAPPTDQATCPNRLKCDYPNLVCNCDGPEQDRRWQCMEPPKPMTMCPPMAPKDAAACKTKEEEPAPPPCHYEEPAVDCSCTADKWVCVEAEAP